MSEPDETPARPLRKDAARNRAALLAAAREVFAERGLEASLDDVAHRAGVGVGTAYRHFANKYELAGAILRESLDELVDLAERCAEADDPWDGLVRFFEGACEAQAPDRGLREVLMGMHDEQLTDETSARITAPLDTMVSRARAAGTIRADVQPSDVGLVLVALFTIADITADESPAMWRRYLPMLLAGLRGGGPLPVPALTSDQLRAALAAHKQRMLRATR